MPNPHKCHYCKAKMGDHRTVDHIVPLSRGGEDSGWNKVFACQPCNSRKGNDWPTCQCKVCRKSVVQHAVMGTTEDGPRVGWIPPKMRRPNRALAYRNAHAEAYPLRGAK